MEAFELSEDADGTRHAVRADQVVSVLPDGEARLFHRNAIRKHLGSGETERVRWLVAELDGVRVYVHHQEIVITKRDLYP